MDQARWQQARLIPTTGISGQDEQEMRATSALLAVVSSVKEFGAAVLRPLDAPAGTIATFIEVQFNLADGRKVRPDGVIREALSAGTLRPTDKGISEVVSRWEQLVRLAALRLERELGTGVQVVVSRKEQADPIARRARLVDDLVNRHLLSGTLRVPNTVGDIEVHADLRGNRCQVSVDVASPTEGRGQTRVNWLTRQLGDAPDQLRVDAFALNARSSTSEL